MNACSALKLGRNDIVYGFPDDVEELLRSYLEKQPIPIRNG